MTMKIKNQEMSGWDSLLSTKKDDVASVDYVHPLVKCSEPTLSQESLEMCTESLGSETGSGSTSKEFDSFPEAREPPPPRARVHNTPKTRRCFPPPLPSISGSGGVHVRRHREDGRLVVMVLTVASSQACFAAERENGRLKLHFTDYMCDGRGHGGEFGEC